jgi:hypothetical protein
MAAIMGTGTRLARSVATSRFRGDFGPYSDAKSPKLDEVAKVRQVLVLPSTAGPGLGMESASLASAAVAATTSALPSSVVESLPFSPRFRHVLFRCVFPKAV